MTSASDFLEIRTIPTLYLAVLPKSCSACQRLAPYGVLLLLLFVVAPAAAQLRIGAHILPSYTGLYNASDKDFETMDTLSGRQYLRQPASFTIGLGLDIGYKFNDNWALDINLNYTTTRQDYLYRRDNGSFQGLERELTMLKIPLLLTYSFKRTDKGSFWVQAGPQATLLLNANELIGGSDFNTITESTVASDEKYTSFTISGVAGAGYEFKISDALTLNTGLRIDMSVVDIENKNLEIVQTTRGVGANSNETRTVNYYETYYGAGRGKTFNYSVGFVIGVVYQLGGKANVEDFRW